ncbi:MAG: hypothetical protein Q8K92_26625 [Leadbetterella sp.]|nr:hypothetical protein [Leadbetterella sp.]
MKKLLCTLTVLGFLFAACEGPEGPQGVVGPVGSPGLPGPTGPVGKDGTNGTNGKDGINGKDGTSTSARYYDFELEWTGSSSRPISDYKISNFDSNKEYVLIYNISSGVLFKQLPIIDDAATNSAGVTKIVEFVATYGTSGTFFISDWNYTTNGANKFKFRAVLIPMVAGSRLSANTPYEVVKKKFNLPD